MTIIIGILLTNFIIITIPCSPTLQEQGEERGEISPWIQVGELMGNLSFNALQYTEQH